VQDQTNKVAPEALPYLPDDESELATKHCRYVLPTEIKLRPTFDDENENLLRQWENRDRDSDSWRTVQRNKQSARDTMSRRTTEYTQCGGKQRDSLCLQKGYLDVRFMFGNKPTAASETFNLARSLKSFIIAGRPFDENFCLLPLYGDGNPISKTERRAE
jgi:hypothetical protein